LKEKDTTISDLNKQLADKDGEIKRLKREKGKSDQTSHGLKEELKNTTKELENKTKE
jgi:hypothetical protein